MPAKLTAAAQAKIQKQQSTVHTQPVTAIIMPEPEPAEPTVHTQPVTAVPYEPATVSTQPVTAVIFEQAPSVHTQPVVAVPFELATVHTQPAAEPVATVALSKSDPAVEAKISKYAGSRVKPEYDIQMKKLQYEYDLYIQRQKFESKQIYLEGLQQQRLVTESKEFYAGIGYPELGGKYAPFEVPEGFMVDAVTVGESGLSVSFSPMPTEEELLRYQLLTGGALPPAGHFGPPSGYHSTPVNLDELVQSKKVTVSPLKLSGEAVSFALPTIEEYHGVKYADIVEKYAGKSWGFNVPVKAAPVVKPSTEYWDPTVEGKTGRFIEDVVSSPSAVKVEVPAGYKAVSIEPDQENIKVTLEELPKTSVPSVGATISGLGDPISKLVGSGITEAEAMQADPTGYTAKKVLTIAGASASLFAPGLGVSIKSILAGAGASVVASQAVKASGLRISLSEGISFGPPGGLLTPSEVVEAAAAGAIFAGAGSAVAATRLIVKSSVLGLTGAGVGYLESGGKAEGAIVGAVIGAATPVVAAGARAIYQNTLRPYVQVAGARIQSAGQRYLSQKYLSTGKLSPSDKLVMRTLRLQSPIRNYVVSQPAGGEWTLQREEATLSSKALISKAPSTTTQVSTQSWAKGTTWSKPGKISSSLNKYIGSGQQQALIMKQAVAQASKSVAVQTAKSSVATVTAGMAASAAIASKASTVQTQRQIQRSTQMVVPATGIMWGTQQQQEANPFLRYSGKPFFGSQSRVNEEVETLFVSTPKSVLATPKSPVQIVAPSTSLISIPKVVPGRITEPAAFPVTTPKITPIRITDPIVVPITTPLGKTMRITDPVVVPIQTSIQLPVSTPIQTPARIQVPVGLPVQTQVETVLNMAMPTSVTAQKATIETVQAPLQKQRIFQEEVTVESQVQKLDEDLRRLRQIKPQDVIGGYSRYKRKYPIMTGKQLLKEVMKT